MTGHPQTTKNGSHPGNLAALYGLNGAAQIENQSRSKVVVPQDMNIHDPSNSDLQNL